MPTLKPRVQVTMEPATHEVIERFAQLQGRTRGAVIADLLDSIAPSLARTVALLEAAIEAPKEVKRGLRGVVDGLHQELVGVTGAASEASKQLDMLLAQMGSDEGRESGVDPHVVTRGSGITPHTSKATPKKPRKPSKPGGSANG
ncbi:hypothetical protein D3C81_1085510 [compost metagenome]